MICLCVTVVRQRGSYSSTTHVLVSVYVGASICSGPHAFWCVNNVQAAGVEVAKGEYSDTVHVDKEQPEQVVTHVYPTAFLRQGQ